MTAIDRPLADLDQAQSPPPHGDNYLNHSRGFLSWALTLDHKRIGIMYMVAVLTMFLVGGIFAIVLRTELIAPGPTLPLGETNTVWDVYNHMFTLHGAVMVFLFIIPAIPAILGNFILPIMLGAKDVAFPRLNLMSFYCWLGGGAFFLWILIKGVITALFPAAAGVIGEGGLDTGWTFYTPYSTQTNTAVIAAVTGAFILGFSSILTGLNFIASIHMLRPRGMTWFRLPLFLWGLYATALIQILATPVLAITLLLLLAERTLGVGVFDPALGGDPVLFQHFFWFYSHPAVYIMILPALGIVSELVSTYSRKHIFGYKFIALSSLAIALFGFIVWGHHMFTSGQSTMLNLIFSILTMSVAIPSAIKVFNWLATMRGGSIRLDTGMLYGLGFIWLFVIGGLTGLYLGSLSTDIHFHDTYFVVAHFHYVMVGSTLFAFMGGMYHWFPKMFGRMYNEFHGRIGWALVFAGFNLTFFIQFIAGSQGMPRRYADYPPEYWVYHFISTLGSYLLAVGLFYVLWNWIDGLRNGRPAPANPWGANTLEWHTPSPPPHENFTTDPVAGDPYDFDQWDYDPDIDGYVPSKRDPEPQPQVG
jgi:cytochrome c oxidase subunit 1